MVFGSKRIISGSNLLTLSSVTLFSILLASCGGGGSSSGGNNSGLNGSGQKGAFLTGSSVNIYELDTTAARNGGNATTSVINDFGGFALNPVPAWNTWSEIEITGSFYNEYSGSNSTDQLTLQNITDVGASSGDINVNLFTHFVASRVRFLTGSGVDIQQAWIQAQADLKAELDLQSDTSDAEKLNLADGASSTKEDNAILLLFSGGFMAINGDANSLLKLTDDFADNGHFDGIAASEFQAIGNFAGSPGMLARLSDNMKQQGNANPPDVSDLSTKLDWVNNNPVASILGGDISVTEGSAALTLDGQASSDSDGTILSYAWTGNGTSSCGNASTCLIDVPSLSVGEHIIELTVTDDEAATGKTSLKVTINAVGQNVVPTANAGTDKTITEGDSESITGSGTDTDGTIASYLWKEGSTTLGTSATLSLSSLSVGTHTLELTVTDNDGATATDTVVITVNAVPNQAPTANAGADKTITEGDNETITGSGTDPDGTIASYLWKEGGTTLGTSATLSLSSLSVGTHTLKLTVTDDDGATATDTVVITVNAVPNQAPTANAGADKTITEGANESITGIGTDADGTITSYQWKEGNTTLGTSATLLLSDLSTGTHSIILTVTDNDGATATDTVVITVSTVPNQTPTANAGADKTITEGDSETITGFGTDTDGTIASYLWEEGSTTLGTSATLPLSSFSVGTHNLVLTVTDDDGATATDTVVITVTAVPNQAPTANAGADKTITEGANESITGLGTDTDGTIASYLWKKGSATIGTNATLSLSNLSVGTHNLVLTVTDDDGATATDTVVITVNAVPNQAPTANAGVDKTITEGDNETITGSGTDTDGTIASYLWKEGSTTLGTSATLSLSSLSVGTHTLVLTVTDNDGATATDTVVITVTAVPNQAPTANAGADKTITEGDSESITGSGTDTDGTIASYLWKEGSTTLGTSATLSLSNLSVGTHTLVLTVTDNGGATATDTVVITVTAVPNQAPTANAGADKTITEGDSESITGSGTDTDGTIASYLWKEGSTTLGTSATLSLSSLSAGTHTLELTVTDNDGVTATDTVVITVNAVPNQTPTANAGADKTITEGDSESITGSGTDIDGTIASYLWKEGSTTLGTSATLSLNNLDAGTHTIVLTVTDNDGAIATDTVIITVSTFNNAPIAQDDFATTEEGQSVIIDVLANDSDPDGDNLRLGVFNPLNGDASLINPENTQTLSGYKVKYTPDPGFFGTEYIYYSISDRNNGGKSAQAVITITVTEKPNELPTANAGVDQTITEGITNTFASGTGADTDGTIESYEWSDGSTVLGTSASLALNALSAGVYTLTLKVTDNDGAFAMDTVVITVQENVAPTVSLDPTDISLAVGVTEIFTATFSDSNVGDILSLSWMFDGETVCAGATTCEVTGKDSDSVLVATVSDANGLQGTTTASIQCDGKACE